MPPVGSKTRLSNYPLQLSLGLADGLTELLLLGLALGLGLTLELTLGLALGLGLADGLADGLALGVYDALVLGLTDGLTLGLTDGLRDGLTLGLGLLLTDGLADGEGLTLELRLGLALELTDGLALGLGLVDGDTDALTDRETLADIIVSSKSINVLILPIRATCVAPIRSFSASRSNPPSSVSSPSRVSNVFNSVISAAVMLPESINAANTFARAISLVFKSPNICFPKVVRIPSLSTSLTFAVRAVFISVF